MNWEKDCCDEDQETWNELTGIDEGNSSDLVTPDEDISDDKTQSDTRILTKSGRAPLGIV